MAKDNGPEARSPTSIDISLGKEIDRSLADIVTALLKPAATEVGNLIGDTIGIASDRIRSKRERNLRLGLDQVSADLQSAGIPLEAITPPKEEELHLCFTGLSLADDPNIRDLWVGLLAQALKPEAKSAAERPFITVLEALSPLDARIIAFIAFVNNLERDLEEQYRRGRQEAGSSFEKKIESTVTIIKNRASELSLTALEDGWADNLLRHGIIERNIERPPSPQMPYVRGLDDRALLNVISHFSDRFELIDRLEELESSRPTQLFEILGAGQKVLMNMRFSTFGTRLATACGLLE
jgi:Abortive infection alpha